MRSYCPAKGEYFTFAEFSLTIWGADEIVEQINLLERHGRKINVDIPICYDPNTPCLIKYHAKGLKGIVCTAEASEIARIVNTDPIEAVFDSDIRRFLGTKGAVNRDIMDTCTDSHLSHLFWFLNNGITIVCDSADPVTDPDSPRVKIKNLQIVNGCQTSKTLALAQSKAALAKDTKVLLRICETDKVELVQKMVLTTNNQNRINSRHLRANDPVQVDMERGFKRYGVLYERTPHQFDNRGLGDKSPIVPNEIVAQSYLAVILRKPSDARRRKYKVWGELYDQIFAGKPIEPYVLATLIYQGCSCWLNNHRYTTHRDDLKRKLANNGTFHIARIVSHFVRNGDIWDRDPNELSKEINTFDASSGAFDDCARKALVLLTRIVGGNEQFASDLDVALKSSLLDNEIERALYAKKGDRRRKHGGVKRRGRTSG